MALTKLNNKSVANVSTLPVALGDMILVSSATASASATIDFTLGDYKEYQFYFVNIHPANDEVPLKFQTSTNNGSSYGVTLTSTVFEAYHSEDDSLTFLGYQAGLDLAQSTAYQDLTSSLGNNNDDSASGNLILFNPSSTTYVKHFIANIHGGYRAGYPIAINRFTAGYFNTTSALTNIRFQMGSGNIDAGTILMYGIN